MGIPLISRDKVIGVLHFRSKNPDAYNERDLRLAEWIGVRISGAIANAQMFAELKKTEMSLRESEEKYRSLSNNIPDIIYSLDKMGNILAVNKHAARYGYDVDMIVGTPFPRGVKPAPESGGASPGHTRRRGVYPESMCGKTKEEPDGY